MNGHLDPLGLDAVRAGEATPEQQTHAESCPECRATIDGFRSLAALLVPARVEIPVGLTRDILALARPRRVWRPVAAAAALLIGFGIWFAARPVTAERLDIVDAYSLAVRLRAGQKIEARWDVNHDGRIDERDVEEIARRSVAIR
jgi:hypothetical protein